MSPTPMSAGWTHSSVPMGAARPIDGVLTVNHVPPIAHHHAKPAHSAVTAPPATTRATRETSDARPRDAAPRRRARAFDA
jgi:hypothetical protein